MYWYPALPNRVASDLEVRGTEIETSLQRLTLDSLG